MWERGKEDDGGCRNCVLERERVRLLSKITGDPIVEILRSKKESCSTQRGLRVGSGFKEFQQTPRGRGFFLLGFLPFV